MMPASLPRRPRSAPHKARARAVVGVTVCTVATVVVGIVSLSSAPMLMHIYIYIYAVCLQSVARGFGPRALGREQSWFTLCAVRQNVVDKAVGEHTQVVHRATRWFFGGAGVDAKDIGVLVRLVNGREIRVFLELGVIAGDEPGIKEMMSCKGHGGAKPCIVCQNVVLHTHTRAEAGHGLHEHDPAIVSIAETDVRRFTRGA